MPSPINLRETVHSFMEAVSTDLIVNFGSNPPALNWTFQAKSLHHANAAVERDQAITLDSVNCWRLVRETPKARRPDPPTLSRDAPATEVPVFAAAVL